jgi:nucleoside-diphosphate-sugar epimerase
MRVFLTGGTGFLGGEVARLLRERGDAVRALVRSPERASALEAIGCELVPGDLSDEAALVDACRGMTAVVHCVAVHDLGAPPELRAEMVEANVRGTERVLGAALTAGVAQALHVSTVAVFGDTHGEVADEGWGCATGGWTSVYQETRSCAYRRAQQISSCGLPLVTVQPGAVYGPGDPSVIGRLLRQFLEGRLPVLPFAELGLSPVHRDDVADGVLRALDKGVPGESYVLAGEALRFHEVLEVLAEVSGRRPPRPLPTWMLRALAPAGPVVAPRLGLPANLQELIRTCDGATSWASGDKAREQLGWDSRPLHEGLRELVESAA